MYIFKCCVTCECVALFYFYFSISVMSCVPTLGLHLDVVSGLKTKTGFE